MCDKFYQRGKLITMLVMTMTMTIAAAAMTITTCTIVRTARNKKLVQLGFYFMTISAQVQTGSQ
jgi:type II secretory pathway component PulK